MNADFTLKFNLDRRIKVLLITDFQPVDSSQCRYKERLNNSAENLEFSEECQWENLYKFIDKLIKDNNPDLILVLGDNVYGEFDDNGKNHVKITNFLDSYKIPWAPIFGNHDNESKMGVTWQCSVFENAKYCLFKRNTVTGNGNYNIAIYNKDKLVRVIYMIDTNGCGNGREYSYLKGYPENNIGEKLETVCGVYPDQIEWISNTASKFDKNVKKTICAHIPFDFFKQQGFINGYLKTGDELFELGKEVQPINGDFGIKGERSNPCRTFNLKEVLKENNFDTGFFGHDHSNSVSLLCDNFIRMTFVIKTGFFDYHLPDLNGGTMFYVDENTGDYEIKHLYVK